jgi:hypothetical protein
MERIVTGPAVASSYWLHATQQTCQQIRIKQKKKMRLCRILATIIVFIFAPMGICVATTTPGEIGDGMTSVDYDIFSGEVVVMPDGMPVGYFDIQSASGIFVGNATLPPGSVLIANTNYRKSWLALPESAFTEDFWLGFIATPGLSMDFLLNDLTLVGSGGLGTPTREFDLVCFCGDPLPVPVDADLGEREQGSIIEHTFTVSSSAGPVTWNNLVVSPGSQMPTIAPVLMADGTFNWDSAGSPIGLYTFAATVIDLFGTADGHVSVSLVPFPGNYNGNSTVDAADYVVWREGLGSIYTQADYDVWRANFGRSAGGGAGEIVSSLAIPEPPPSILIAAALAPLLNKKKTWLQKQHRA